MEKWRQISSSAPLHPRDNLSVVLGWGASQGSELLPAESRAPVVWGAFLCFWLAHVQLNLPVTVCRWGLSQRPSWGQKCWRNTAHGPVWAAASSHRQGSEPTRRAAREGCSWRYAARTLLNQNLLFPFRSHAVPVGKPLRRVVLWPA